MSGRDLIDSKVALVGSDPWEFVSECGAGPFQGNIKDEKSGKVLVCFNRTLLYDGIDYSVCICSARHHGKDVLNILNGEKIPVNIMLISGNVTSLTQIDQRGQHKTQAIIGTIEQA